MEQELHQPKSLHELCVVRVAYASVAEAADLSTSTGIQTDHFIPPNLPDDYLHLLPVLYKVLSILEQIQILLCEKRVYPNRSLEASAANVNKLARYLGSVNRFFRYHECCIAKYGCDPITCRHTALIFNPQSNSLLTVYIFDVYKALIKYECEPALNVYIMQQYKTWRKSTLALQAAQSQIKIEHTKLYYTNQQRRLATRNKMKTFKHRVHYM